MCFLSRSNQQLISVCFLFARAQTVTSSETDPHFLPHSCQTSRAGNWMANLNGNQCDRYSLCVIETSTCLLNEDINPVMACSNNVCAFFFLEVADGQSCALLIPPRGSYWCSTGMKKK